MKKKRFTPLYLLIAAVVSIGLLVGCSSDSNDDNNTSTNTNSNASNNNNSSSNSNTNQANSGSNTNNAGANMGTISINFTNGDCTPTDVSVSVSIDGSQVAQFPASANGASSFQTTPGSHDVAVTRQGQQTASTFNTTIDVTAGGSVPLSVSCSSI